MSFRSFFILGLTAALSASATAPARHPREPTGLPVPYRDLPWGDVNFLSTSDTHGWLLGHQHLTWPEPNYSGDYGDFASFATHMRRIAREEGADLLLVDAGDHHDGSGLVSSSFEGASRADEIFQQLEYDVMTIGNHELYSWDVARVVHEQAKELGGRYITSNVNITLLDGETVVDVPVAERYRKFTTPLGRHVTAFGCIFEFLAHDYNLTVQATSEMVKEQWFIEAIQDAPDYFVIAGHMPARGESAEFIAVFDAIRAIHPHVPTFIFGGHTHVRDCVQYDDRSIAIVPGRYMETIAFTSSNLSPNTTGPLDINRRYIDANRISYRHHTHTNRSAFDTDLGQNISKQLSSLASNLNISKPLGIAPDDLYLSRYPFGHQHSALTHFAKRVLPATVKDNTRRGKRVIIGNAGSLRFDLFAGPFNRNDELTISPFPTKFLFTPLPAGFARQIEPEMNRRGASKLLPGTFDDANHESRVRWRMEEAQRVRDGYQAWVDEQYRADGTRMNSEAQAHFVKSKVLTPGYITTDECKGRGDDIEHAPLPHSVRQPDFLSTPFPKADGDELIDVVVMDFTIDDFIAAVHSLDPHSSLGPWDFAPYAEGTTLNHVWGMYARQAWNP